MTIELTSNSSPRMSPAFKPGQWRRSASMPIIPEWAREMARQSMPMAMDVRSSSPSIWIPDLQKDHARRHLLTISAAEALQHGVVKRRKEAYEKAKRTGNENHPKTVRLERLWMEARDNMGDLTIPVTADPEQHFQRSIYRGQRTQAFLKAEAAYIVWSHAKKRERTKQMRSDLEKLELAYREKRCVSKAAEKLIKFKNMKLRSLSQ